MAQLRVFVLVVLFFLSTLPAYAAQYECTVDVVVQNGEPYPVTPPVALDSGDEEGLQYEDAGVRLGGFEGWLPGELVRLYALIKQGQTTGLTAQVYLHTSPEKMVRWHNEGWGPSHKKIKAKHLISPKAKDKKPELVDYEGD